MTEHTDSAHLIKQVMKISLISLMHLKFTRFRNKDKSQNTFIYM